MTLLAIPWKRRFFSRLRFGAVGVNIIAAIAFLYHIEYVRTGLSNHNQIIESIIFLAIVGTFILAFLLIKPSSIRNPLVCSKCGYDLRGMDHDKCPECGWGRDKPINSPAKSIKKRHQTRAKLAAKLSADE
ncbi:MAG: hypothetical protein IH984_02560 [Planctomycetes bacterium]|nr:hypothetical protein [Planctomycetota bacterium]